MATGADRELKEEHLLQIENTCRCFPGKWGICIAPTSYRVPEIMVKSGMQVLVLGQCSKTQNSSVDQLADEFSFIALTRRVSAMYQGKHPVPIIPVWSDPVSFFREFKMRSLFSVAVIEKTTDRISLDEIFSQLYTHVSPPDGKAFVHFGYWEDGETPSPGILAEISMWEWRRWLNA